MNSLSTIDLSVVMPAYNEELLLEQAVERVFEDAKSIGLKNLEIIIVDDGSKDETGKIGKNLKLKHRNIKVVIHKENKGLGAAITSGIENSKYRFIAFLPADCQVYLSDIVRGLKKIQRADLVLNYRLKKSDYTLYRLFLSKALLVLMKIFFNLNFRDLNWAHIYRKDIFEKISPKSKGVFFLTEVVARANVLGLRIQEAPSLYRPRTLGKAKNAAMRVAFRTLIDLIKLKLEFVFGKHF